MNKLHDNAIWAPCTAMKDYESFPPVPIDKAQGIYLYTETGQPLIDAISSWWCKNLGHQHPRLREALFEQAQRFEHIILANTENNTLTRLGNRLAQLQPGLTKVNFSSDGSCAVDMAIKMSLHAHRIRGESQRQHFVALSNSYHGETGLSLSVTEMPLYREIYAPLLMDVTFLQQIPYVNSVKDPLWDNCSSAWPTIEAQLLPLVEHTAAILVEPIVQAAGGMKIYSADFLRRLSEFAQQHGIHLIVDEIFTGFGRTGLELASQHTVIQPDFMCLGKGLTGGWLPMSVMLTSDAIYDLFYVDYDPQKTFFHSHTHSGNALAAAVANATLDVLEEEQVYRKVTQDADLWFDYMQEVAEATGRLHNLRHCGAVIAADLKTDGFTTSRLGFEVFKKAMKLGALLRPLGNTIYWVPPLIIEQQEMEQLRDITIQSIREVFD